MPLLAALSIGVPLISRLLQGRDVAQATRKNRQVLAMANLQNALNPRAQHAPALTDVQPSLLSSLAQAGEIGLGAYNTFNQLQTAQQMQGLQKQLAEQGLQEGANRLAEQRGGQLAAQQQVQQAPERARQLDVVQQGPTVSNLPPPGFLSGMAQERMQRTQPLTPGEAAGFLAAQVAQQDRNRVQVAQQENLNINRDQLAISRANAETSRYSAETGRRAQEAEVDYRNTSLGMQLAQLRQSMANVGRLSPKEQASAENDLLGTFTSVSKDFRTVQSSWMRMQALAKDPSPAGDIGIIFSYMKVLDPTSTVREGEYATAESAGSIPQAIWNKYNKALEGERLGETRADFINTGQKLYTAAVNQIRPIAEQYQAIAERRGLDPRNILLELQLPEQGKPGMGDSLFPESGQSGYQMSDSTAALGLRAMSVLDQALQLQRGTAQPDTMLGALGRRRLQ